MGFRQRARGFVREPVELLSVPVSEPVELLSLQLSSPNVRSLTPNSERQKAKGKKNMCTSLA